MNKTPCHISDEVIANDPQDAPDAVYKDHEVIMSITATVIITVNAENELDAIAEAKKQTNLDNFYNIEWSTEEVIEQ